MACLLCSVAKHGWYASEMFCDVLLLFSEWDFSEVLGLYQWPFVYNSSDLVLSPADFLGMFSCNYPG